MGTCLLEINEILSRIQKMIEKHGATAIDQISSQCEDPFAILISTVISHRTKDEVTLESSRRLLKEANSCEMLRTLSKAKIEELIYPAGFFRKKAETLQKIAKSLQSDYGGTVPSSIEELLKLPGVGRKTANLVLAQGFNIPAICVDIHVHRISNRLGLVRTKNPDDTEAALKKIVQRKRWTSLNSLLVSFGKVVCTPVSPHCTKCLLSNECPKNGVSNHR
jgi:endonuclease-3